jgi:UDP-2,3-diacylglucosamine pyrophosphatase LpxH
MPIKKRVFVSDVHMSPGWSLTNSQSCYDWFNTKEATDFAKFLNSLIADNELQEVILLGDLMDAWVYPIEIQPPKYDKIAGAQHVQGIMTTLRELAAKKKVIYVMGNHDMTLVEAQFDNLRQTAFKNITFQEFYDTNDGLHAEHGHSFTMYNAIDPKHEVPLGHFISRLAATLAERKQHFYNSAEIESRFPSTSNYNVDALGMIKDPLVNAPLTYLADELGNVNDNTPITTVGGGIITLGEVRQQYSRLGIDWIASHHLLDGVRSAWREAVGLDDVAFKIASDQGKKIVIFGHTHKEDNYYLEYPSPIVSPGPTDPPIGIYANCGAWCNDAGETYVIDECEYDDNGAPIKHTITLKYWQGTKADIRTQIAL